MITLEPGLVNTALCTSEITYIDGDADVLRYHGICAAHHRHVRTGSARTTTLARRSSRRPRTMCCTNWGSMTPCSRSPWRWRPRHWPTTTSSSASSTPTSTSTPSLMYRRDGLSHQDAHRALRAGPVTGLDRALARDERRPGNQDRQTAGRSTPATPNGSTRRLPNVELASNADQPLSGARLVARRVGCPKAKSGSGKQGIHAHYRVDRRIRRCD
jgi:hypothetical protein